MILKIKSYIKLKFTLITSVILVTISSFGAVAQTETYKNVVLDGKLAKLNVKTGVITYNDGTIARSLTARKIKDSVIANNTVIKKNPILMDSELDSIKTVSEIKFPQNDTSNVIKSNSTSVILTNKPDTLVTYYKNKMVVVGSDSLMNTQTVFISTNASNIDATETKATTKTFESEPLDINDKAIAMPHEVSKSVTNVDNTSNFHKVLKGETLYIISQRYQTSLGALKKANNLETTLVTIGQILRINNFEASNFGQLLDHWTVSKGETLYSIAKKNSTTVDALKSLNGLASDLILIGQTLQLK